jgi:ABC-type antimicrobial peptide transport system permease subunit
MAAAGLIVAGAGILGLTAGATSRRTREMGVRLALGSTRGRLLGLMVREQLMPIAVGLTAGLAVAAWGARFAQSLLYELSEYDPGVWLGASVVVLLVALAGILVPAARASRVDPVHALRVD